MHRNRGHCGETASGACGCDGGVTVDAPSLASAGDDDTDDDAEPERERSDATCSGILSSSVGLRFGGGHECVSCWFGETKSRPYDVDDAAVTPPGGGGIAAGGIGGGGRVAAIAVDDAARRVG